MNLPDSKSKKTIALTSIAALALLSMVAAPLITQQRSAAQALSSSSMNMTTTATTTSGPPGSAIEIIQSKCANGYTIERGICKRKPSILH